MKCAQARSLFSPYLDGAISGAQMQALLRHLAECAGCAGEYARWRGVQRAVAALGPKKAPADLNLRLRLAISREAALTRRRSWPGLPVHLENLLHAFMVPVTAGVVSAIVIFGLLIGFFALPQRLQASSDDVPTMLYTPPQLAQSPFSGGVGTMAADSLIVEAYVDANGRVQDYRILSAPTASEARALLPELENMLIFTVFRPATAFGRPTAGRAVLSFSKINVKG